MSLVEVKMGEENSLDEEERTWGGLRKTQPVEEESDHGASVLSIERCIVANCPRGRQGGRGRGHETRLGHG